MERSIHVDKAEYAAELFGSFDVNAKRLEKAFGVTFSCRDSQIHVIGEEPGVSRAVRAAESLLRLVEKGEVLNDQNVGYCIDMSWRTAKHRWRRLRTAASASRRKASL